MSLKILIVDDDPVLRSGLSRLLAKDGHELCLAETGEGALRVLEQESAFGAPIRLVLLDVHLGHGWDGIEVSRRMRVHEDAAIRAVAVFLVTGASPQEVRDRAAQNAAGRMAAVEAVRWYVTKPVDMGELRHAIAVLERDG